MYETGYDVLTSAETKEKLGDITFITAELSGKEITANKKNGMHLHPVFLMYLAESNCAGSFVHGFNGSQGF